MTTIQEWQKEVRAVAESKGWNTAQRNIGELLALVHSEVSEALEEWRSGRPVTETYHREDGKPEGVPSELADVVIRCLDIAEAFGIDLGEAIARKNEFNKTRSHRHGGKIA